MTQRNHTAPAEEGKCGSCELKGSDGKKYRVCVVKVPNVAGPLKLN